MAAPIDQPTRLQRTGRRPLWLFILAGFSILLGIITTIPQFYYVLFALHIVIIGPNSNPLGLEPALPDLSTLARSRFALPALAICREGVRIQLRAPVEELFCDDYVCMTAVVVTIL